MPRGFKDKALLGRKGQGSGRDSADILPAGRWWQEGSRGVVPVSVLGHPSLGETHGEGGTEPPGPMGEGYRDAQLELGAQERGHTLATAGTLGWMVSYVTRGTANVDPERRCHMRGHGAQGWGGRAWGPVGLRPGPWLVQLY